MAQFSVKIMRLTGSVLGENQHAQNRLMPSGQDYETVGELYHALAAGLSHLTDRLGEAGLFTGLAKRQIGPDLVGLPGLQTISTLSEALAAIDTIVEQGEGAPAHTEDGHYQRFVTIRSEYEGFLKANPRFVPARPVAANPVMRKPVSAANRVWVNDPQAAAVMDYANALYGQMLRLLCQAFGRDGVADEKRVLVNAAIDLMFALTPAAEHLGTLAANGEDACNAGMSFAMLRPLTALPQGPSEWRVLDQRFAELEATAASLAASGARLAQSAEAVTRVAAAFRTGHSTLRPSDIEVADASPPVSLSAPAAPTVRDGVEVVEGKDVTLAFDTKRCIHARHCVTGAPRTFLANVEGPWLHPDETSADQLAIIASMCPSGAITLARKDGRADETAPEVNTCQIRENGPLAFRADLRIDGHPDGYRATLSRCGQSRNKPWCDGSHVAAGFQASGEPATVSLDAIAPRGGPMDIRPQTNGPLAVSGPLEICAGTGRVVQRVSGARLCRCGASANKPFCDGSHGRIGFKSSLAAE
ncbi:CDGSH iron-sulfur domain-containing protein [Novosphingobium sp.]|uniref:CDGSH iron-sulfur domain-containing protein n=1 Tax=Novosphingobium sp. TaxID=1874826 RepID=UPI0025DE551A|nr:CDGSH iron-sulfur domain-containing protein [Novosphingobium sp.]